MRFSGQYALITGAAGDLGQELCVQFARELGLKIIAMDLLSLEETRSKVLAAGGWIETFQCDLRDRDEWRAVALKYRPRVWINNAGMSGLGLFHEQSLTDFEHVLDINLGTTVYGSKLACEIMLQEGAGWIVNIASVAGHIPAPHMSAYAASKHAIVGLTRCMADEFRYLKQPIRTLLVSPGFFSSKMVSSYPAAAPHPWIKLDSVESVTREIVAAMRSGRSEIAPTLNAKLALGLHRLSATALRRLTPFLIASSD